MFLIMPSLFGTGAQLFDLSVPAFIRGGNKVVHQTVEFDFSNSVSEVTDNNMDGGADSGFGNVIATVDPSATTNRKFYGVLQGYNQETATPTQSGGTLLDDSECKVAIFGRWQALVFETTGALAKGDDLFVEHTGGSTTALVTDAATLLVGATPALSVEYPIVGKCLETVADADPAIAAYVFFSGWIPLGTRAV